MTAQRLPATRLPALEGVCVVVVGDVMLDRYWQGADSRISPEAPVPAVRIDHVEERPGGAANVALNLAALGARPVLYGLVGSDDIAERLEARLVAAGVSPRLERVPGAATITKLRVICRGQQLIRLDAEVPFPARAAEALVDRMAGELDGVDALVCSDYAKGTLQAVPELIRHARSAGVPVLVDPKGTDIERYRGASVLTPNRSEFEAVVGHCADATALAERGVRLAQRHGLEAVLVTRGEEGMSLLCPGHEPLHQATRAREVFDVTGAGDTVIATLAAMCAVGESMTSAMTVANAAAGCVVAHLGAAVIDPEELQRALGPATGRSSVVIETAPLCTHVATARARGDRIVLARGVFDRIDLDVLDRLEAVRDLGERLVVAVDGGNDVDTDGPRRMRLLGALSCVDWVVPVDETAWGDLLQALRPDHVAESCDRSLQREPEVMSSEVMAPQVITPRVITPAITSSAVSEGESCSS